MPDLYVKHSPSDSLLSTYCRETICLYMVSEVIFKERKHEEAYDVTCEALKR